MSSSRLVGKVVAVTGGARGIGRATATAFAARGAKVAIGDRDIDEAKKVAAELGSNVIALPLDVTEPDSFAAFLDDAENTFGPLDVLVNNAGVMMTGDFLAESPGTEQMMIDINLRGVILGCKLAAVRFAERRGGRIVNIASMAGIGGFPGVVTYCATKFGVVGLTMALREELSPAGVNICAVLPGIVHTELSAGIKMPRVIEQFVSVEPDDIARAVVAAAIEGTPMSYVPGQLKLVLRAMLMVPEKPRRALMRLTRMDGAYLSVDQATRDAYHARVNQANQR